MAVALLNFLMLLNSMTQSQYSGTKEKSQLELICFTSSNLDYSGTKEEVSLFRKFSIEIISAIIFILPLFIIPKLDLKRKETPCEGWGFQRRGFKYILNKNK